MVVDTTSQTTILALTCHTCTAPLRFSFAATAKEHVAEASIGLPLKISHLGGPSWDIPFPHQAATSDQPRTPPHGEGHLPDPASLTHLPLPCRKLRHDSAAHVGSQKQLRAERARVDYREKTMSAELGVCKFTAERVHLPPMTAGATFDWDGIGTVSRCIGPHMGTGRHPKPSLTAGDPCLVPSSPPQALDWEREAQCLTVYLDQGLLLATACDMVSGATGELMWAQREGHAPVHHPLCPPRAARPCRLRIIHRRIASRWCCTCALAIPCSTTSR